MANLDITGLIDKLISFLPEELQEKAKSSRKAIVSGIGALLTVLNMLEGRFGFLIPKQYQKQVQVAITILTAVLTYLTPNEPAPQPVSPAPTSAGLSATARPATTP